MEMMEDETRYRKYEVYGKFIRKCLRSVGLIVDSSVSDERNFLFRKLPFVVLALLSFSIFGYCHFVYHNFTDLNSMTRVISTFGSTTLAFLKVIVFCVHGERIRDLHRQLGKLFEECLRDPVRRKSPLFSMLDEYYIPAYTLFYSTVGIMTVYATVPSLLILVEIVKNVTPRRYILPLAMSFPWKIQEFDAIYLTHYVLEVVILYFIINATCGVDTLFGYYVFQMSAILRTLSAHLENMPTQEPRRDIVLKNCVEKQVIVMRCCGILQSVYGSIVLWMTITSALIMCSLVFQAFQTTLTVGKFILFVFYMFMKMAQALMYAWYGSKLTSEEAVYFCDWWTFESKSAKKSITIILPQRRLTITALGFFNVSMDLFIGILNTTASYFFLLQTLADSDHHS